MLKNKILKNIVVIFMIFISIIVLTGCGNKEENVNSESQAQTTKQYTRGKWDGDVYTSEFAKIKFKMPKGWQEATVKELAETMGIDADEIKDEKELEAKISEANFIYDMMATNPETSSSVAIMVEGNTDTAGVYAEALKKELESMTQIQYEVGEVTETKIGEDTYKVVEAKVEIADAELVQNYYIRSQDGYIFAILVTETSEKAAKDLIKCFE